MRKYDKILTEQIDLDKYVTVIDKYLVDLGVREGSDGGFYDSSETYWNHRLDIVDLISEDLEEVFLDELEWSEDKYMDEVDEIEVILLNLISDRLNFDQIDSGVDEILEEMDDMRRDPYGARGLSRSDFY